MRSFLKPRTLKRTIVLVVVALCSVGLACADQTIQSVQQALKNQGFYYGNVTGEKSAETTAAIRRYQIRNGLQVTGDINQETLRSLNTGSNSAASPSIASKPLATQPSGAAPYDESQSRSLSEPTWRAETNLPFLRGFYDVTPAEARTRIVTEVQLQLMSREYYRGWVDGRYGPRTVFAVREFQ